MASLWTSPTRTTSARWRQSATRLLLYDCLLGDATLFRRADAVEVSWCAVQGLLDDWKRNGPKDLPSYAAGSSGPKASDELLARDKRAWLPIKPERRHLTASNVC